jgi:3-oxoacyl-[acyl-carrier protein] reductase
VDLNLFDEVKGICDGKNTDVLVHAAGGIRGQTPRPIEDISDDDWSAIYEANVMSALNLVRLLVPGMKKRNRGRIITISSGAGLRPSLTGIQAYCSAKHALVGLTRQLSLELGPHGITVNSVAPGFLRTSPDYERQWQGYGPERQARMVEGIAMRRLGAPEDISAACLFLASDRAGYITGQVLPVSGHPFP